MDLPWKQIRHCDDFDALSKPRNSNCGKWAGGCFIVAFNCHIYDDE